MAQWIDRPDSSIRYPTKESVWDDIIEKYPMMAQSPVFKSGYDRWDPTNEWKQWIHNKAAIPLNLISKSLTGEGVSGSAALGTSINIQADEGADERATTSIIGHELGHLGWDYTNKLNRWWNDYLGSESGEELWNKMHDVRYQPSSYMGEKGRRQLSDLGYMKPMTGAVRYMSPSYYTPKGIESIRGSGLIPEHQAAALGHYIPRSNVAEDQRIRAEQASQYTTPQRTFSPHADPVTPTPSRQTFDAPPSRYHQEYNRGGIASLVL